MITTRSLVLAALAALLIQLASATSNTPSFARTTALSGIPRGGGWFGRFNGKNNNKHNNNHLQRGNGGGGGGGNNNPKKYPCLTQQEIEEKLNIPVFAITDMNGNSVVARTRESPEDCCYLFLSQKMAENAMQQLMHNNTALPNVKELKLVPLHLGKLWFRYLHNDTAIAPGSLRPMNDSPLPPPPSPPAKICFRLVPETRNLISARLMASGINPKEVQEAMMNGPQEVNAIVRRATNLGQNFTQPFNDIPLFLIPSMRAQANNAQNENDNNVDNWDRAVPLKMPLFFGAKDLLQAFLQQNQPTAETKVSVTSLHQLIDLMQQESDFDFRSVVLFPLTDESSQHDDDNDDDDKDGGGGDNGIAAGEEAEDEYYYDEEPQIEMFTEFGETSWEQQGYQQLMGVQ